MLELFNLTAARQTAARTVFTLAAHCCELCEIQGIFGDLGLREIMAHCQPVLRPEIPTGMAYWIPV